MKKTILAILTAVVSVASSQAQIMYDSFNYTVGNPLGTTPATNGNWLPLNTGTAPLVASGNLDVAGLQSSTGNSVSWATGNIQEAYTTFSSVSTGLPFYSFAFRLTALPTGTTYSFGLIQPGTTTFYGSTIWLRASGSGFNIGLDNRSSVAPTSNYAAPTYDLNDTIFIVGSYEFVSGTGNDVSRIWINPSSTNFGALSAPTATITATGGTDLTGVGGFLLRGASGSPSGAMDELRIGTGWADVTPVPEPSSTVLMVLGAAGLIGIRAMRRKSS